jgi:hypothetical protein
VLSIAKGFPCGVAATAEEGQVRFSGFIALAVFDDNVAVNHQGSIFTDFNQNLGRRGRVFFEERCHNGESFRLN